MFDIQPYKVLKNYMEKSMEDGERVLLSIATPQGLDTHANPGTFTFDVDNYDINGDGIIETLPFKNKMLLITGMRFVCQPTGPFVSPLFGAVQVDGRLLLDQAYLNLLAGMDVPVDGMPQVALGAVPPVPPFLGILPTGYNAISVQDAFGVPAIPCRNIIRVWTSAQLPPPPPPGAAPMLAFFSGLMIDRKS